ncbi:MAG: hypothetical protein FJW63_01825 [Actinobacteria bacterium]|nr:hypothetical protein [Actinomycetota bacterium]
MKEKLNIPLTTAITIGTIIFSIGGSWALIKSKSDDIDKVKVKAEDTEKKVAVIGAKLDFIEDTVKETKENLKEQRQDLKQMLQILTKKER